MEKEIKDTGVEIESEKTVEETTPEVKEWKAPESKEDLDVLLKAEANRTYTQALKDLGVSSVKEFKELQTSLETKSKDIDKVIEDKLSISTKYDSTLKELESLKEESILNKLSVNDDYKEDLLSLARAKVDEDNSLESILTDMVANKYKYTTTISKPSIGIEKSKKENTNDYDRDALTKL